MGPANEGEAKHTAIAAHDRIRIVISPVIGEAMVKGSFRQRFVLIWSRSAPYKRLVPNGYLDFRPISTRRRIASGLLGLSGCLLLHSSTAVSGSGCSRTMIGVPFPVGAGPRRFRGIKVSCLGMESVVSQ